MTIFVEQRPHIGGGTLLYNPSPIELVAAKIPDNNKVFIMPHGAFKQTIGGRVVVRNRFNADQAFIAPAVANSPTYETGDANGYDVMTFVHANTSYLAPSDPAGMALGTTTGFFYAAFKDTATVNGRYLIANSTLTGAGDYVPNIQLRLAGAIEHLQIVTGNAASARVLESSVTDLNTTAYHTVLYTWNSTGFRMWLDGIEETLTTTDTNGFSTSGRYEIGRRAAAYLDAKLACLFAGRIDLGHADFNRVRNELLVAGQSQFIA